MYSLSNEAEMSVKSIFDSFRSKRILSLSWVIFESKYSSHSSGVQSLTEYESKGIYNRVAQVTYPDTQRAEWTLNKIEITLNGTFAG